MCTLKRYQRSLFIFRRDLRCDDNTALMRALLESQTVVACFIFDPRQIKNHLYKSEPAYNFMLESLADLAGQIEQRGGTLYFLEGLAHEIVDEFSRQVKIQAVYVNEDYTPFSVTRDLAVKKVCDARCVDFHSLPDALLNEPKAVIKNAGGVYTVFTPFFKKAREISVNKPQTNNHTNFTKSHLKVKTRTLPHPIEDTGRWIKGGRRQALTVLNSLKRFKEYDVDRDIPAKGATTELSAHHKFGTCSIRETYHAVCKELGQRHTLIRELYWRDFFTHIAYHFPHVFGQSFYDEYNALAWARDEAAFEKWCEGRTGFPIVDAGMRELNKTAFMHNRVRMITASFLVKDLHIDWRRGEQYFAKKLVDYDPCVNNGNWQWAASTGCDHQPYFRIFNPWLQQKRFDPDCRYIKKWVPELKDLDTQTIHQWYKDPSRLSTDYPVPMLEHGQESQKAKDMFRSVKLQ